MASKSQQGFVLFEVLIAAVILATGCVILVESLQGSQRAMRRVQDNYEASLNAGNMLWVMKRSPGTSLWTDLVVPGSLRDLKWSVQTQTLRWPGLKAGMDAQTLTLQWQPLGRPKDRGVWTFSGYALHENPSS